MAAALVVSAIVVTDVGAAWSINLSPTLYLVLALVVAFQSRLVGGAAVALALVLTVAPWALSFAAPGLGFVGAEAFAVPDLLTHLGFIALFGALAGIVHGAEVLERRRRHRMEVAEERENLMRQARELRLLSTRRVEDIGISRKERVEMITRDAVDAVNHAIFVSLSLLQTGLECHTCILLWFDVRGEELRIKELVSRNDDIIEGTLEPARGVFGGITRRREAMRLDNLKPGFRGLVYYRSPQDVTQFLGVPVLEDGHLRGVLAVDRTGSTPFDDGDVKLVEDMAAYIVRAVENERTFASIEKSKHELGRFFDASRKLNSVITPEDVYRVSLECAAEVSPYDFAAITTFDPQSETHTIVAIDGTSTFPEAAEWLDLEFDTEHSLVPMVVRNRHYLPYGGVLRDDSPVIFDRSQKLEGLQSLLVLPLIVQDKTIGTFVVGHRDPNQFGIERREMLEVVGNQIAVTMQNSRLYEQMKTMATTDGLTGLANHRKFQTKLDEAIARHKRSERPFCVLLTDIDHFKHVNDTYGHPVGDEVLRQVSKCFQDNLRETDLPARYGGEEFAIILDDTDVEEARIIADRIRTELKKLVYQTDQGPFSCTISIGLGVWPRDGEHKQTLIDHTDQALYHSKESGRDRVTAFGEIARIAS